LDRTILICDLIESHLLDHQWFAAHPDLLEKVTTAQKILYDVANHI
jgi:hypothetical protein